MINDDDEEDWCMHDMMHAMMHGSCNYMTRRDETGTDAHNTDDRMMRLIDVVLLSRKCQWGCRGSEVDFVEEVSVRLCRGSEVDVVEEVSVRLSRKWGRCCRGSVSEVVVEVRSMLSRKCQWCCFRLCFEAVLNDCRTSEHYSAEVNCVHSGSPSPSFVMDYSRMPGNHILKLLWSLYTDRPTVSAMTEWSYWLIHSVDVVRDDSINLPFGRWLPEMIVSTVPFGRCRLEWPYRLFHSVDVVLNVLSSVPFGRCRPEWSYGQTVLHFR